MQTRRVEIRGGITARTILSPTSGFIAEAGFTHSLLGMQVANEPGFHLTRSVVRRAERVTVQIAQDQRSASLQREHTGRRV